MKCVLKKHTAIRAILASVITLAVATIDFALVSEVYAQSAQVPATIIVPQEMRIDAGSETLMGIDVKTGYAAPAQLLLLVKGLPAAIALSHGRLFASGVWALRLVDLAKLKIAAQPGSAGSSELSLSLVGVDGTVLTQRRVTLVITAARVAGKPDEKIVANKNTRPTAAPISPERPKDAPDLTSALPPISLKPATGEAAEEAKQLMARGDDNLKTGKIIVARKFYERAAENGWAPAALALGRTYDPQELAKVGVIGGIKPDLALAKLWYERARDMGLAEASDSLQRIGAR